MIDNSYKNLANFYDRLGDDIPYDRVGNFISEILVRDKRVDKKILLDLACGTGKFSCFFAKKGYDVIGIDLSNEMLNHANEKAKNEKLDILFLNQDMTAFELYGTVDVIICMLDAVNHLLSIEDLRRMFKQVSLYLNPGGFFIFDINLPYRFNEIYSNNTYVDNDDELFFAWENDYDDESKICRFDLTFFEKNQDGTYTKYEDTNFERCYREKDLIELIHYERLELIGIWDFFTLEDIKGNSEKAIFVTKKPVNL